jgi:HPt (histidine-containing phosphotransfer) domain-containing protein
LTKQSVDNNGDQMIKKWLNSDPQIKHLTLRAVKSLPHKLSEISEALENNSYKKAAFKVHNLKGLALNFNLKEIYVITDKLNKELKEENYDLEKIESLYQELDELIKKIPESYL